VYDLDPATGKQEHEIALGMLLSAWPISPGDHIRMVQNFDSAIDGNDLRVAFRATTKTPEDYSWLVSKGVNVTYDVVDNTNLVAIDGAKDAPEYMIFGGANSPTKQKQMMNIPLGSESITMPISELGDTPKIDGKTDYAFRINVTVPDEMSAQDYSRLSSIIANTDMTVLQKPVTQR